MNPFFCYTFWSMRSCSKDLHFFVRSLVIQTGGRYTTTAKFFPQRLMKTSQIPRENVELATLSKTSSGEKDQKISYRMVGNKTAAHVTMNKAAAHVTKLTKLLLLLVSGPPYSGSPQPESILHLTRSTSSPF